MYPGFKFCRRAVHTIGGGELTIPYTNTDLSKKQKLPMEPCIHDSIGGWSEWRDSNSRHPAPKAGALPAALHPDTMELYTKRMENATEIYHFREIRRLPQNCGSPGLWINSRNLPALRRKARRNRRCKFRRLRSSRPTRHCRALRAHPGSGWCPHFR